MGVLAYVLVLQSINKLSEKFDLSGTARLVLTAIHFVAGGIAILFVPAWVIKNFNYQAGVIEGMIFAIPVLIFIVKAIGVFGKNE